MDTGLTEMPKAANGQAEAGAEDAPGALLLSFFDRVVVPSLLPRSIGGPSGRAVARLSDDVRRACAFTEEETRRHGIRQAAPGRYEWESQTLAPVALSPAALDLVIAGFEEREKAEDLPNDLRYYDLYDRLKAHYYSAGGTHADTENPD